jgi:hypothetical protein
LFPSFRGTPGRMGDRRRGPGCEYCSGKSEFHFCYVCGEIMRPACGGRDSEGGVEAPCPEPCPDPRMFSEIKGLEDWMKPTIDENLRELLCECPKCPSGCTCFSFRVPASEADLMFLDPENHTFVCPRGHTVTWEEVRGTLPVDTAGYSVDRNHPLHPFNQKPPPSPSVGGGDCGVCGSFTCNGRCRE